MLSKRCGIILRVLVFSALAAMPRARAATVTWVTPGPSTNDWSGTNNWSSQSVPANGDEVIIISNNVGVLLTSATAELSSLLISNKVNLIFSNWNSSLTATNVMIATTAALTLPAAFSNNAMSNRVWIICSNLSVAAGASINADSKGYRGALSAIGETDGHGPGGSASSGGASYGGKGASVNAGPIYGDASAPTEPGSGGGYESGGGVNGGAGGGAIRIQASGAITNNGTITANGANVTAYSGSGSGGGIYITCNTLSGSNGIIRANGGSSSSRSGAGGGRIAVIYDTDAQTSIPSVLFQSAGGPGNLSYGGYGYAGTLYFPNNLFLSETFIHAGEWSVPGFTSWSPNTLLVSNGWLRFPANGFRLTVTNDLSIVGTNSYGHRIELTNGMVTVGGNIFLTNGGLRLYNGATSGPALSCSSNLTLTNGAAIYVYSGWTNPGPTNWNALIGVTGDVFITGSSTLYLYADPTNGGSALLRMRNLTVGTGAAINADSGGFMGRTTGPTRGYGPGGGYNNMGGGYGGRGGPTNSSSTNGAAYGNSNAPIEQGSAGGTETGGTAYGGRGGGAIRIQAAETMTINGTLTANGGGGSGNYWGGGSGGGIYLTCRTFIGSTNGLLRANGAFGSRYGGGAGRIAVWRMYDQSTSDIATSVTGGTGNTGPGADGTFVWGWFPAPGTIFSFR